MSATIITTDDLREFKLELLEEIQELLLKQYSTTSKKWLRSKEVRELLGISPGTLQNLRINGTLPYDEEEINAVLEKNRIHHTF